MIALPSAVGLVGALLLAVGVSLAAAVLVPLVRSPGGRALLSDAGGARRPAFALLVVALASAVAVAPVLAWRIVQDLRYTTRIPAHIAERLGAYERDLDGSAFDRVAALIPPHDTYWAEAEYAPGEGSFEAWAKAALLPRIAVGNPGGADWLVTFGIHPRIAGVPVEGVRRLRTSYGDRAEIYVARVAR